MIYTGGRRGGAGSVFMTLDAAGWSRSVSAMVESADTQEVREVH
jgi:hypothetical protein